MVRQLASWVGVTATVLGVVGTGFAAFKYTAQPSVSTPATPVACDCLPGVPGAISNAVTESTVTGPLGEPGRKTSGLIKVEWNGSTQLQGQSSPQTCAGPQHDVNPTTTHKYAAGSGTQDNRSIVYSVFCQMAKLGNAMQQNPNYPWHWNAYAYIEYTTQELRCFNPSDGEWYSIEETSTTDVPCSGSVYHDQTTVQPGTPHQTSAGNFTSTIPAPPAQPTLVSEGTATADSWATEVEIKFVFGAIGGSTNGMNVAVTNDRLLLAHLCYTYMNL